jgi:hypothetical protein
MHSSIRDEKIHSSVHELSAFWRQRSCNASKISVNGLFIPYMAMADCRRADFSHEETMKGFRVWAGDQGGDATRGARPRRVPHTVIALAKRPITSGACGSSRCGDAEGVWTMNVAVLTQATHRYTS